MIDSHITIVSGLPRSGTSLMMQMLQAGGMQLLTDGLRAADESNPRGYFEYERLKHGRNDLSWVEAAAGQAVKVIHLFLQHLPAGRDYRIIFMERNLEEVIASQRAMLKNQGRTPAAANDAVVAGIFEKQLVGVREWLAQRPNFQVLYMKHSQVIAHPLASAEIINDFLGGDLNVANMAESVKPDLYRQRKTVPAGAR
jgi:hypothetical protein